MGWETDITMIHGRETDETFRGRQLKTLQWAVKTKWAKRASRVNKIQKLRAKHRDKSPARRK